MATGIIKLASKVVGGYLPELLGGAKKPIRKVIKKRRSTRKKKMAAKKSSYDPTPSEIMIAPLAATAAAYAGEAYVKHKGKTKTNKKGNPLKITTRGPNK